MQVISTEPPRMVRAQQTLDELSIGPKLYRISCERKTPNMPSLIQCKHSTTKAKWKMKIKRHSWKDSITQHIVTVMSKKTMTRNGFMWSEYWQKLSPLWNVFETQPLVQNLEWNESFNSLARKVTSTVFDRKGALTVAKQNLLLFFVLLSLIMFVPCFYRWHVQPLDLLWRAHHRVTNVKMTASLRLWNPRQNSRPRLIYRWTLEHVDLYSPSTTAVTTKPSLSLRSTKTHKTPKLPIKIMQKNRYSSLISWTTVLLNPVHRRVMSAIVKLNMPTVPPFLIGEDNAPKTSWFFATIILWNIFLRSVTCQ